MQDAPHSASHDSEDLSNLPPPLVPKEVDLRDFPYMPLDVMRLLNSEFYAIASDAEFRAGATIWFSSWHEVPAASVPDCDKILCHLARLGRDMRKWKRVKDVALRGWVKCSDERLYHPIVAEKAMNAWREKLRRRARTEAARRAKARLCNKRPTEPVTEPVTESVTGSKGNRKVSPLTPLTSSRAAPAPDGATPLGADDVLTWAEVCSLVTDRAINDYYPYDDPVRRSDIPPEHLRDEPGILPEHLRRRTAL